jgi:hypothetical protein
MGRNQAGLSLVRAVGADFSTGLQNTAMFTARESWPISHA